MKKTVFPRLFLLKSVFKYIAECERWKQMTISKRKISAITFHEIVRFDPETSKCWDSHYETLGVAKWTSLPTGNIAASSNGKKWKKGLI